MVHRYIADTLVTPLQLTVSRYLDRRFTDDRPMHWLYDEINTQPIPGRYIDRYISTEVLTAISVLTPPIRQKVNKISWYVNF